MFLVGIKTENASHYRTAMDPSILVGMTNFVSQFLVLSFDLSVSRIRCIQSLSSSLAELADDH